MGWGGRPIGTRNPRNGPWHLPGPSLDTTRQGPPMARSVIPCRGCLTAPENRDHLERPNLVLSRAPLFHQISDGFRGFALTTPPKEHRKRPQFVPLLRSCSVSSLRSSFAGGSLHVSHLINLLPSFNRLT